MDATVAMQVAVGATKAASAASYNESDVGCSDSDDTNESVSVSVSSTGVDSESGSEGEDWVRGGEESGRSCWSTAANSTNAGSRDRYWDHNNGIIDSGKELQRTQKRGARCCLAPCHYSPIPSVVSGQRCP